MILKIKKGISPVVATALLLVVAVVAVVGFQTWFSSYQGGVETQVEGESGEHVMIHRVEYDPRDDEADNSFRLYFSSGEVIEKGEILLNGDPIEHQTCGFSEYGASTSDFEEESQGNNEIEVFRCQADAPFDDLEVGDVVTIMIQGEDGIYSFDEILRDMR